jgi:hypothetical protein
MDDPGADPQQRPNARIAVCSVAPAWLFWYQLIMASSIIIGSNKKKRGRPALYEGSDGMGAQQIGLRMPPPDLAAVDAWIANQPKPKPSRPEAIRRLVARGLKAKGKWTTATTKVGLPIESSEAIRRLVETGLKATSSHGK